jgi:3-phosphoshikimate 1-carboxyvinyltransferase
MHGGLVKVNGSVSSQFVTGLLLALPVLKENSVIEVDSLASRHYIDITLSVMNQFGVNAENYDYKRFEISGGQSYKCTELNVEGDWSGSSFLLVAAAIAGKVKIKNLNSDSLQPDKAILKVLEQCGANIKIKDHEIVCKHKSLNAFEYDATNSPDLFPPLVALASKCKGKSRIIGTHRLIYKESNRLDTLIREFSKMGVLISSEGNSLVVESGSLKSVEINPENDHRIAMAAAITYLGSNQMPTINQAECVNKSFPGFWEEIKCLGVKSEMIYV